VVVSGATYGVLINGSSGVTVSKSTITATNFGIEATFSDSLEISDNTVDPLGFFTSLQFITGSNVLRNAFTSGAHFAMLTANLENDFFTGNTFTSPLGGVLVQNASIGGNTFVRNLFTGAVPFPGLWLLGSNNTTVYNNNFETNVIHLQDDGGSGNVFDLAAPTGGNWFDTFDESGEGCDDLIPVDGFCDAAFTFPGGQDDLPSLVLFDLIPN
jgi:hypothetical protein